MVSASMVSIAGNLPSLGHVEGPTIWKGKGCIAFAVPFKEHNELCATNLVATHTQVL